MPNIKRSIYTGLSFGLTSGTITTLGLMIGLYSGTNSRLAVLGGIFTIAIADALSDALGIHISEESENTNTKAEIWEATIATFFVKFFYALTFALPVLLLNLNLAILTSIIWGYLVLGFLSYVIAKKQKEKSWKIILEHLLIMTIVIIITYYVGILVNNFFV